jgi:hypothetical protein
VRHLENLQRKGGFKGFNQHAVSLIIAETGRGNRLGTEPLLGSGNSKSEAPSSKEISNPKLSNPRCALFLSS